MFGELVKRCRSYRRFDRKRSIDRAEMEKMVENARLSASGANRQPLKYYISNRKEMNDLIFPTLSWAGYLTKWDGRGPSQRPSGYIVILGDREISDHFFVDHGIAAWSILLTATDMGLGGCMIASVDRKELGRVLELEDRYEILLVVALGKPDEDMVIETAKDGDIEYYREDDIHHVPKRSMDELIIN